MKWIQAYCRMFIVTFSIGCGGLFACGTIALALINFVGIENRTTRICLYILIIPALISFLLGVGLGDTAFRKACTRISEVNDSSPNTVVEYLEPKDENRSEQVDDGKPDPVSS